jgi:hypothetical protein
MGRVSRILKAASESGKEPAPTGLEPLSKTPPQVDSSSRQADTRADSNDLTRLMACWAQMPAHFKQTILTLVEVTEASK